MVQTSVKFSLDFYMRGSWLALHPCQLSRDRNLELIIQSRRVFFSVSVHSGFRRLKEDQLPRLIAKIEEFFPNYAKDKKHVQKIVDIVNCCVYDERLVSVNLFCLTSALLLSIQQKR